MSNEDIEVRRKKIATIAKWALGLAGAAIISPVIFLAVKGIVGLAIAGFVGFVSISMAPVVAMKVANWRIKLITMEAETNPIETMKVLSIEKAQELEQSEAAITEFETEIRNYNDHLEDFVKQYPEEAETYKEIAFKMREALDIMRAGQKEARERLAEFKTRIAKAEAIYKMALAAQRVTTLSKSAEAKVFMEIKEKVAFDTVRSELNRSFSQLNSAISRRSEAAKMPASTADRVQRIEAKR